MLTTFPTSHAEMSPLKAAAPLNTAPHDSNKEKSNNGWKKRGESIVQK